MDSSKLIACSRCDYTHKMRAFPLERLREPEKVQKVFVLLANACQIVLGPFCHTLVHITQSVATRRSWGPDDGGVRTERKVTTGYSLRSTMPTRS